MPTRQRLYLADKPIAPQVYNIDGSNYIGLRALGELMDFSVGYDYDNRRITVYAAYPYAAETVWNAAMNDLANNLRVLPPTAYPRTAARYAPVVTAAPDADWRALVSTLRAAKDAPPYVVGEALHRSSLYWANAIAAAQTDTVMRDPPRCGRTLAAAAPAALFRNPDGDALRADFQALSAAYHGAQPAALADTPVTNGYTKDARARSALADAYTLTAGADAADRAAAQRRFARDTALLSALPTDDARVRFIYDLLRREYRTGGTASWTTAYGRRAAVSPRSLAAAADWLFAEAGFPAFLARSWSAAWNVVYVNGQWAVFDFAKGSDLRPLDEYRLIDTHPASTYLLTQIMRPNAGYAQSSGDALRHYFTYTPIAGSAQATAAQMRAYLTRVNPAAPRAVLDMIPYYIEEGAAEGIRGDIAFAQSCLETGNFTFRDSAVTLEQNNFCGLGVVESSEKGVSFDTPQLGIRAQIQHLKAYAGREPLRRPCIDPRFSLVPRGAAQTVQHLGIQENPRGCGWAAGADYGVKILNILDNILAC